jgi:hypothetical protein
VTIFTFEKNCDGSFDLFKTEKNGRSSPLNSTAMNHTLMTIRRPEFNEYHPVFKRYIDAVDEEDIVGLLARNKENMIRFLETIGWEKWDHAYAPGKWTLAEVIGHLIDYERIFAYRALRIARNDMTPMSGFEQDELVKFAAANQRLPESLVREYAAVETQPSSFLKILPMKCGIDTDQRADIPSRRWPLHTSSPAMKLSTGN